MNGHDPRHIPVLAEQVMRYLSPEPGQIVVDATVGLGGHARILGEALGSDGLLIGLDVDASHIAAAQRALAGLACRVVLRRANFRRLKEVLDAEGVAGVDVLLADLGVSSMQLDDPSRGMSFRADAALDMRMDDRLQTTAADLVNSLRESELADVFYHNADERRSRRIAKGICRFRRGKRITRTDELSQIVCDALGVRPDSRKSRIHPATRVFQALRIAVNDELGALDELLVAAPGSLNRRGRVGVISFHSIEDRRVKQAFRRLTREGLCEIATKRPVVADAQERRRNPRARSAKLRVARRLGDGAEPRRAEAPPVR